MERKKTFIFIGAAILILVIILLLFQSCEPRNKLLETEDEIYTAFINANIDFTCKVLANPEILEAEDSREELNKSFSKFYLPVDDDQTMVELLQRYESDLAVISVVQTNTAACASGGEAILYQRASQ